MNEFFKKIGSSLIVYGICLLFGFILGIVVTGRDNGRVAELSAQLNTSKEINRQLQIRNNYLSEINNRLTERTGELEEQIIRNNSEYQKRLGIISEGLVGLSEGFDGTGKDLQRIIDKLGTLKKRIELSENIE